MPVRFVTLLFRNDHQVPPPKVEVYNIPKTGPVVASSGWLLYQGKSHVSLVQLANGRMVFPSNQPARGTKSVHSFLVVMGSIRLAAGLFSRFAGDIDPTPCFLHARGAKTMDMAGSHSARSAL